MKLNRTTMKPPGGVSDKQMRHVRAKGHSSYEATSNDGGGSSEGEGEVERERKEGRGRGRGKVKVKVNEWVNIDDDDDDDDVMIPNRACGMWVGCEGGLPAPTQDPADAGCGGGRGGRARRSAIAKRLPCLKRSVVSR